MHSHKTGVFPVALALLGNLLITIIKFIGFLISGSGAVFSEAVHSFADTLNQSLLFVGLRNSTKNADDKFSYGYGKERFFWALISACGIFFLGSGVTIYHGIELLSTQEEPHIQSIIFIILVISFLVELVTFIIAVKELSHSNKGMSPKDMLAFGDPATIAVIYEDGAAVLGVLIALGSLLLTMFTGNVIWDAIGSITIGVLLGIIAIILIRKNRQYLIGMNIPEHSKERIIEILEADPAIDRVLDFKSSILNIGTYHVKCEVEFNGTALIHDTMQKGELKETFANIHGDYSEFVRFLVAFIGRVPRSIGTRIDKLEKMVQKEIPEIRHIDIEIN